MKNFNTTSVKTCHGTNVFKEHEAASKQESCKKTQVAGAAVPIQEAFEKKKKTE